jgi:hypothetical protein
MDLHGIRGIVGVTMSTISDGGPTLNLRSKSQGISASSANCFESESVAFIVVDLELTF